MLAPADGNPTGVAVWLMESPVLNGPEPGPVIDANGISKIDQRQEADCEERTLMSADGVPYGRLRLAVVSEQEKVEDGQTPLCRQTAPFEQIEPGVQGGGIKHSPASLQIAGQLPPMVLNGSGWQVVPFEQVVPR